MEAKTFEMQVSTVDHQIDEESLKLAEELGLKGQVNLGTKDEKGFPYKALDEADAAALTKGFETKEVGEYSESVMPIEILKVIAYIQGGYPEYKMVVCFSKNEEQRFLLAKKEVNYKAQYWLLGTWGPEIQPLNQLTGKAKLLFHQRRLTALRSISAQVTSLLSAEESLTPEAVLAEPFEPRLPSFFNH